MDLKLIRKNIFVFTSGETVSRFLNFIALVYVARILIVQDFGLINLAIVLVSYFSILLGFVHDDIATKEISEGVIDEIDIRNNVLSLRLVLSLLLYSLLVIIVLLFLKNNSVKYFSFVFGLSIISTGLYTNWFFRAKENFLPISIALVGSSLINLISVFLFINNPTNANIAIWIITSKEILNSVILFGFYLNNKSAIKISIQIEIAKRLIKNSIPLALSAFFVMMNFSIDQLMLGVMTNPIEIGYYSASVKIIFLALIPSSIIYQTFFPQMTKSNSNNDDLKNLMKNYSKVLFAIGLIISIVGFTLSREIIEITFGKNYQYSIPILQILMLNLLFGYFNRVYGNSLIAIGKQNLYLRAIIIGVLVNIVANLILIPKYLAVGSAYASVVSELLLFLVFLFIHKKNFGEIYLNNLIKAVFYGLVLMTAVLILRSIMVPTLLISISLIVLLLPMFNWIRKILFAK